MLNKDWNGWRDKLDALYIAEEFILTGEEIEQKNKHVGKINEAFLSGNTTDIKQVLSGYDIFLRKCAYTHDLLISRQSDPRFAMLGGKR